MTATTKEAIVLEARGMIARLARNPAELRAAQKLRYEVFFAQQGRKQETLAAGVDYLADEYDECAETLIVIDTRSQQGIAIPGVGRLVGTYRFVDQEMAKRGKGFVADSEFDLRPLMERNPDHKFVELSRAAVHKEYRDRDVLKRMWRFIAQFVLARGYDVMLGAASFDTTNVAEVQNALAFLKHHHSAPPQFQASAQAERYLPMGEYNTRARSQAEHQEAFRSIPTLIRGYLNAGAYIGDGATIDYDFGTIDVLIILPMASVHPTFFRAIFKSGEADKH